MGKAVTNYTWQAKIEVSHRVFLGWGLGGAPGLLWLNAQGSFLAKLKIVLQMKLGLARYRASVLDPLLILSC